ncbi:MAG TPA: hypothetical protein DCR93_20015 [Cytophagales bacterium]|nr:hypothetical protein [Cytophagales bacterium]
MVAMTPGQGISYQHRIAWLAELAQMGYRVTNPELISQADPSFFQNYRTWMQELASLKGGHVKYVPLFSRFPEGVPDQFTHFKKRLIGYLANFWHVTADGRPQPGWVPDWLFNAQDFGADPITQLQHDELYEQALKAQASRQRDTHIEWTYLTLALAPDWSAALQKWMQSLLYAKAPIKAAWHADLTTLLDFYGVADLEANRLVHKENKAWVMRYAWQKGQYEQVLHLGSNATDVLRMFAALKGSDVSLSEPIRFPKLTRAQRRCVMQMLDQAPELAEDLMRYRALWRTVARYLHPGEFASKYPHVANTFRALHQGKLQTLNSKIENLLAEADLFAIRKDPTWGPLNLNARDHRSVAAELVPLLQAHPGVFARRLHEVLRKFEHQTDAILRAFEEVCMHVPFKNLLMLQTYFRTINEAEHRAVVNKHGKLLVMPNQSFAMLSDAQLQTVDAVLSLALSKHLARRNSWAGKKVWIDPMLGTYLVPLQQRKASEGLLTVGRGSKVAVPLGKVLRLFVYWKEQTLTTDLDLSVIQYDAKWNYLGHVSYTHLQDQGIVHSGDITSAPFGAAEFIDITLNQLPKEVHYLGVQVYRYAGEAFSEVDCHAGWMVRDKVDSRYASFDIKTVVNKVDLNGDGAYAIPLVVDIKHQQVVMTDLFVSGFPAYNRVENAYKSVAVLCQEVNHFVQTRPNMLELAYLHAGVRGAELVTERDQAEISFGTKDCTYNASDVGKILSELI